VLCVLSLRALLVLCVFVLCACFVWVLSTFMYAFLMCAWCVYVVCSESGLCVCLACAVCVFILRDEAS